MSNCAAAIVREGLCTSHVAKQFLCNLCRTVARTHANTYADDATLKSPLTLLELRLQGLYKQMVESFKSLGVEATPGVGFPFDPNFHDAIMQEPNDDVPDGTVLAEFRKGFKLGDKLLRAAMVKVTISGHL